MANQNYAFAGYNPELMARVVGRDLRVSTKQAIAVCAWLRKKNLQEAQQMLKDVIAMKRPVPFKRFTNGLGHKPGMAAGRYPSNTSKEVLKLLNSVEVNAQSKGLNTSNLEITHICAHQAYRAMHYGRQIRRQNKASHVEVVVKEGTKKVKKERSAKSKPATKPVETTTTKPEVKAEAKPVKADAKPEVKAAPAEKKEEPKAEAKPAEKKETKAKPAESKSQESPKENKEAKQ